MVSLVERTAAGVDLHKRLAAEQTPRQDGAQRHAKAEATDRQIDALVYELRPWKGLTDEEIKVVEGR